MDNIVSILIAQLRERFDKVEVYDEPVQQGLSLPCFIINAKKATHKRLVGDQMLSHIFVFLTYYPRESEDMREEIASVMADFMTGAWRYLGKKHHIHNLDMEHNDQVLTVSFSIDVHHVMASPDGAKMDSLAGAVASKQEGESPQIKGLERKLKVK
ncbi:MAG: hypothetical protein D8B54_01240 [Catonella sp.]|nr:MAG: hypothetical protein D8B54_01240 [Catonella sp.]